MGKQKFKIIKVIVEEQYLIEMYDEEKSHINGWTLPEIIKDWFQGPTPLGTFHASREGSLIGNSRKYISSKTENIKTK
jgi:hypothetical protein